MTEFGVSSLENMELGLKHYNVRACLHHESNIARIFRLITLTNYHACIILWHSHDVTWLYSHDINEFLKLQVGGQEYLIFSLA